VWERVKHAAKHGLLGPAAKVATAKPNPLGRPGRHVVCVYTYDWRDEADVLRVREELRRLGITETIYYKSDEDTLAGRYSGAKRVSKYRS
jgi:hypothetical protein